MKHTYKKLLRGFLLTAFTSGLTSLAMHIFSAFPHHSFPFAPLAAFGTVAGGMLFWAFCCTAISLHAKCGMHASLLVLCFHLPWLLCAAFFAQHMGLGTLCSGTFPIFALLGIPSAALAWVVNANRQHLWMRMLLYFGGALTAAFDAQHVLYGATLVYLAEMCLLVALALMIYYAGKHRGRLALVA
jgi:hypothetical protein